MMESQGVCNTPLSEDSFQRKMLLKLLDMNKLILVESSKQLILFNQTNPNTIKFHKIRRAQKTSQQ